MLLRTVLSITSNTPRGLVFSFEIIQMIQNQMITIFPKTDFTFLKVRSEPFGQHLSKVKDSKQEGPLPFIPGRLKSHINICRRTTNDSFVPSVIQHGYRIQWKDSTPPPPFTLLYTVFVSSWTRHSDTWNMTVWRNWN